jgi:hypothetical protein
MVLFKAVTYLLVQFILFNLIRTHLHCLFYTKNILIILFTVNIVKIMEDFYDNVTDIILIPSKQLIYIGDTLR